jgi:DNA-binding transcriptional regulator YiaG
MPAIPPKELRRILDKLELTLAELAGLLEVHPVTARKWSSSEVPKGPAAVLIRLLASGEVSTKAIKRASRSPKITP